MRPNVPAVVILGQLNGLGVSRSLGCGGVPIYVVDRTRLSPGMWSHYARPVLSKDLEHEELVSALLKLQFTLGERPVLFNTHEMAVLTISKRRSILERAFRFRLPKHEIVLALQDKARFHELAILNGLPVPRAEVLRQSSDISKLRLLRFPVVIKPADKAAVHYGKTPGIVVLDRFRDAVVSCERMLEQAGETIAQEWVDGANDEIYFCLFYRGRSGTTVSMFTGRKLSSSPPGIGLTAFCTAAPDAAAALEPMTKAFLDKLEYAGLGGMEYKWDIANHRFLIIEPTVGRTDWQEEIATLCGVNIPLEAYRHELELPPVPRIALRKDVVWQASFMERLKVGCPVCPANATVYDGYWRCEDPMPAVIKYSWGTCGAAVRKLRKWIRYRA